MNSTHIDSSPLVSVTDIIYVVQGSGMCLGNGLLVMAILTSKQLRNRKEVILFAGLGVADFVYGIATMLAGALRIDLTVRGLSDDLITPWDCMLFPPTPIFTVGQETVGLMLVILSIDRYIAVAHFSTYRMLGTSYAYKVLSGVLTYAVLLLAVFFSVSYFLTDRIASTRSVCIGPVSAPPWFGSIDSGLTSFYGFMSVIIYIVVYYKYRQHLKIAVHEHLSDITRTRQLALQRRVTVTLGTVTFFTFVFFCIPIALVSLDDLFHVTINSTIIYTLTRVNSIVNIVVYFARQKEVRKSTMEMITCWRKQHDQHNQLFS